MDKIAEEILKGIGKQDDMSFFYLDVAIIFSLIALSFLMFWTTTYIYSLFFKGDIGFIILLIINFAIFLYVILELPDKIKVKIVNYLERKKE